MEALIQEERATHILSRDPRPKSPLHIPINLPPHLRRQISILRRFRGQHCLFEAENGVPREVLGSRKML